MGRGVKTDVSAFGHLIGHSDWTFTIRQLDLPPRREHLALHSSALPSCAHQATQGEPGSVAVPPLAACVPEAPAGGPSEGRRASGHPLPLTVARIRSLRSPEGFEPRRPPARGPPSFSLVGAPAARARGGAPGRPWHGRARRRDARLGLAVPTQAASLST